MAYYMNHIEIYIWIIWLKINIYKFIFLYFHFNLKKKMKIIKNIIFSLIILNELVCFYQCSYICKPCSSQNKQILARKNEGKIN